MATAQKTEIEVPVITKTPAVVLTLSVLEAQVLVRLFNFVGGDPIDSARGVTNRINDALRKAGVEYPSFIKSEPHRANSVFFATQRDTDWRG